MLRCAFISLFLSFLSAAALAHTVTYEGTVYQLGNLKGGELNQTDCCDEQHCRVAFRYVQTPTGWTFYVPFDPKDMTSRAVVVEDVPERLVQYRSMGKGERQHAVWCGTMLGYGKQTLCAFIPRTPSANRAHPNLDAMLRLKSPAVRGAFSL